MRRWFLKKAEEAAANVSDKKKEYSHEVIEKARVYISRNYKKDLSLESRQDTAHTHTAGKAADAGDALHHLAAPLHIPCPAFIISLLHVRRQEAINLGVLEYLHKPVNQKKIVEVIRKAMSMVDSRREKRSRDLETKEKLEIVVPMLEL